MKISIRRVGAAVLDFFLMLGLFWCFVNLYNVTVIANDKTYQNNHAQITEICLDSHIYVEEDGELKYVDNNIDEHLTYFYTIYPYEGESYGSYIDSKRDSGLFVCVDDECALKADVNEDRLNEFFKEELDRAAKTLANHSDYKYLIKHIDMMVDIGSYVSIVLSGLVTYFVLPLIFRKGRTLGKLVCFCEVVNENDTKLTFMQILIRAWAMTFIMLLSFQFFFLPLLINVLVTIFDKKHRSINDFCAVTLTKDVNKEEGKNEKERR